MAEGKGEQRGDGSAGRSAGRPSALAGLPARLRNQTRAFLDASFGYETAWAVAGTIVLALLLASPPTGVQFGELVIGQPAPRDLIVPMDVEIPDEARTAASREAARRDVSPSYVFNERAARPVDRAIREAFETGRKMRREGVRTGDPAGAGESEEPAGSSPFDDELSEAVLAALPPGSPPGIVDVARGAGFSAEMEKSLRSAARSLLTALVVLRRDMLPEDRPISVRNLEGGGERLLSDFSSILDLDSVRAAATKAAQRVSGVAAEDRPVVERFLSGLTTATLTLDQQETARRMDEAAGRVPTLFARILRGTVLVRKGTPLTQDVIDEARAVERAKPGRFGPVQLAGSAAIAALLFSFLWYYPRALRRGSQESVPHLFSMMAILAVVMLFITRALLGLSFLLVDRLEPPFDRLDTLIFLIPAAAGGMLAALLFSHRAALVYSIFFSIPYAMICGWDLKVLTFSLFTHFAALYGATHYRSRTAPIKAGGLVGLVGAAVAVALALATGSAEGFRSVAVDALAAFAGGAIGVSLLVSFLLPIFEGLFGLLTEVRLLELSNLNNPLLSRLAASAPGSYNHSLIVGTLAEAAAEEIGGNGLLCRVAAFYHDIGKMKMPEYYIENQRGQENPHNRLAPSMSALVIANHVKDGIRLGRDHGLPRQILDMIPQHHGTRVMTYFYEKAKEAAGEESKKVNPDDFRYPGPRPQTREAAIFMLADSVEAAARTISEPEADKFRAMVKKIAGRIALDGQFDECDLTFRDLDRIIEAFVRSLVAIYHRRVDYPSYVFEKQKKDRKETVRLREVSR